MPSRVLARLLLLAALLSALPSHAPAAAADAAPSFSPKELTLTLEPGERRNETFTVQTGAAPIGKADVLFVFDRTASMGGELAQAKASATRIMADVRAALPQVWFGVGGFMDYPATYSYPGYTAQYGGAANGDVPWKLDQRPTDSTAAVAQKIGALTLGWGGDEPESYTRALDELTRVDWRPDTKRVAVVFGDAPAHDLDFGGRNFGGDPGADGVASTADDLDFEATVRRVADAGIAVIAVDSGGTAASEATFRAMSEGGSGVAGTGGRYAQLAGASQLPDLTTRLIREETQQIDRLSIEVTDGYGAWVQIAPAERRDVAAGATVTFDVTFSVPEGTTPGFHALMLRAVGDGVILGVSPVDITVPAESPVTDTGFRPSRDGFAFKNIHLGEPWFDDLSWEMFRQFFGADQVEYPNGNRIEMASRFYEQRYRTSTGDERGSGFCAGFSGASGVSFRGLSQDAAGDFALPRQTPLHDQVISAEVRDALGYAQGVQWGLEYVASQNRLCERLGNSPAGMYRAIKAQIAAGSPAVVSMQDTLLWSLNISHAVLAYRVEEPSKDQAYIYVYDSEYPGDDGRRIEVDLKNDRWIYELEKLGFVSLKIGGDKSACTLKMVPIDVFARRGVPFWARFGATFAAGGVESGRRVFGSTGPVRLLFTDDEGRRLGWVGDTVVQEIPGADAIAPARGEGAASLFALPSGASYTVRASRGPGDGLASVSVWDSALLAELSELALSEGASFSLEAPPDAGQIAVVGVAGSVRGALTVSRLMGAEDRTVTVGRLTVGPGERMTLGYNSGAPGDRLTLTSGAAGARTFDLSLRRAGGAGYRVFSVTELSVPAGARAGVELSGWDLPAQLPLRLDVNADGVWDSLRQVASASRVETVSVEAQPGAGVASVTVLVRDQLGAFVADGTPVQITTTRGRLSTTEARTVGGLAHLTLATTDGSGVATVTATAGGRSGSAAIELRSAVYPVYLPLTGR